MIDLTKEQSRIINHDKGNLLVSASAGSGKTFVMIERAIKLIKEGKTSVSEILAVTFTEKAAADMKEKMSKALLKALASKEEGIKEQLALLSIADVCTLHSFCAKLLRNYFFEANLSADFTIADENDSKIYSDAAIENVFERLYQEKDEDFLDLVKIFSKKRSDKPLKELVVKLYKFFISKADFEVALKNNVGIYLEENFHKIESEYFGYIKSDILLIKDALKSVRDRAEVLSMPSYATFLTDVLQDVDYLLRSEDVYSVNDKFPKKRTRPRVVNKDKVEEIEELKETVKKYYDALYDIKDELSEYLSTREEDLATFLSVKKRTESLVNLILLFEREFTALKREDDKVDFNDLERLTIKLFENERVLNDVKSSYKYIFVDEYQDVNDVQEEIIRRISNDNVFMVGDVKQSIYGFRGCNPEIFQEKFERLSKTENAVKLNVNFRSSDKVIDFANAVFNETMTEKSCGVDYKDKAQLVSSGLYKGHDGRAILHVTEKVKTKREEETARVYSIKEELKKDAFDEEYFVGNVICDVIEGELNKTYYSVEDGEEKPINYGDIAILVRSNSTFTSKLLQQLNKRHIPVTADTKSSITEYPEIKFLIDVLKLLDNFNQDVPLVSVLTSKIGNVSLEELSAIRLNAVNGGKTDGFYNAVKKYIKERNDGLTEKLKRFIEYFKGVRLLAEFIGAGRILEKIIAENGIDTLILSEKLGRQKLARVERFLAEGNAGELSVKEFLDRILNSSKNLDFTEVAGDNTVKIMTMHASKGLEFPVTIVAGLDSKFNKQDINKEEVIREKDLGFVLNAYNEDKTYKRTLLTAVCKRRKEETLIKEELRLFYVALTRAKYAMHVVRQEKALPPPIKAQCFADFVSDGFESVYYSLDESKRDSLVFDRKSVFVGESSPKLKDKILRNLSFEYKNKDGVDLPVKTSVTASLKSGEEHYEIRSLFDVATDSETGTAVHKFFENLDFDFLNDLEKEKARQIDGGLLSKEQADLIDVEKLLKTASLPIFEELKSYRLFREQNFVINCPANLLFDGKSDKNEVLLQGVIDLLAIDDEGAIIVDYKYSKKGADALRKTYEKQLKLYKYAVEKALNIKVKSTVIISLAQGEIVKID